jgi:hypothetical protein
VEYQIVVTYSNVQKEYWITLKEEAQRITQLLDSFPSLIQDDLGVPNWKARMNVALARSLHHRVRRGWFDAVGKLSNVLFGTATQEQIDDIQHAVNENRRLLQHVSRVDHRLMVVVNATWDRLNHHAEALQQLTTVTERLLKWASGMSRTMEHVHNLRLYNRIQEAVVLLEEHSLALTDWQDDWHLKREQVTRGRLSERLLNKKQLSQITGNSLGTFNAKLVSPIEWYFSYVLIQPFWINEDLTFLANIPLVKDCMPADIVQTFPVLVNNNVSSELMMPELVAVHNNVSIALNLVDCVGKHPLVCKQPPKERTPQSDCNRAVLGAESEIKCRVNVKLQKQKLFVGDDPNHAVILTTGENVTEYCPNDTVTQRLGWDTYSLQWGENCTIVTNNFELTGMVVKHEHSVLHSELWETVNVTFDLANMTSWLQPVWLSKIDLHNPDHVVQIPLDLPIPLFSEDDMSEHPVYGYVNQNVLSIITLILLVITVVTYLLYRLKRTRCHRNQGAFEVTPESLPKTIVLHEGMELNIV